MRRSSMIFVFILTPILMASHCQTQSVLQQIRDVHVGVREAFVRTDGVIAPMIDSAGDECIAQAQIDGLTGAAAMASWRSCMALWVQLDQMITMSREAMVELENIYNAIEAGSSGEDDWKYWAIQVVAHARAVLRIMDELNIEDIDPVVSNMRSVIDQICSLVRCDGGAL